VNSLHTILPRLRICLIPLQLRTQHLPIGPPQTLFIALEAAVAVRVDVPIILAVAVAVAADFLF
jgi:hypothetical protein